MKILNRHKTIDLLQDLVEEDMVVKCFECVNTCKKSVNDKKEFKEALLCKKYKATDAVKERQEKKMVMLRGVVKLS